MNTYKRHIVKKHTSLLNKKNTFSVLEQTIEVGKGGKVIDTKSIFDGTITECESYLNLLNMISNG